MDKPSLHRCSLFPLLAGFLLAPFINGAAFGQLGRAPLPPARGAPSPAYFGAFSMVNVGNFIDGADSYRDQARGGIKIELAYWIDSICYNAMAGECLYQMGQYQAAMKDFDRALEIFLAYQNWMQLVTFQEIRPTLNFVNQAPWGRSARNAPYAALNDTYPIQRGNINNNAVFQQGGVVRPAELYAVSVQEIVRCTALAIRRRRDILGPVGPQDALTLQVKAALDRRPGHPNHWSEAWIDVQVGVANAAAGKMQQAKNSLERAVSAGNQFDHPLTGLALFELGRIAIESGDLPTAERNFYEASISAWHADDYILVGESLNWLQKTRIAGNQLDVLPVFAAAAQWARQKNYPHLHAVACTAAAENANAAGDPKAALGYLNAARAASAKRQMINGRAGAQMNYQTAVANYSLNDASGGSTALAAAMKFQETGSLWLYHIAMVDGFYLKGTLNARLANDLFSIVLREPGPADWRADPLECLSAIVAPRYQVLEHWFDVAIERKEAERAFEIADAARRARFMATLEFGGRLHSIRWLLEGPDELLDATAKADRQNLLANFPAYSQLSQEAQALRASMTNRPVLGEDKDAREQTASFNKMSEIAAAQEALLRRIAVGRNPAVTIYPPARTTVQLQKGLPERTALLRFFVSQKGLYAFLMSDSRFGYWRVGEAKEVQAYTVGLLREMRNLDQNKELTGDDLKNESWKATARDFFARLMEQSRANLGKDFDELVIVPDGALWYLPFEALQIDVEGEMRPLISQMRIRYAPLAGMATADPRPRRQGGSTAVALGKLWPRDDAEVAQTAFDSLAAVLPDSQPLRRPVGPPSSLWTTLFDRLIVYNDLAAPGANLYAWSPAGVEKSGSGNLAGDWFALPWGGPEEIILPGFHTPAENGLKGVRPDAAGMDLFLNLTGLMSNGARTVLISRWRPGGQSSYDLVREFAQELPQMSAPDAWQRAYQVVSPQPLNTEFEPRISVKRNAEPPTAEHPFFWGAFLLADTGQRPVAKPASTTPGFKNPAAAVNLRAPAADARANANRAPMGEKKEGNAAKLGGGELELKDPVNVR